MSEHDRDVWQIYGKSFPITFVNDQRDPINLANAIKVVEFVEGRPPRPARVIEAECGRVAFPDDLEPGVDRLQYEVYWPNNIIESVPPIPQPVRIKAPDVEADA